MTVELDVKVAPAGVPFTIDELAARLPDLALTVAPALKHEQLSFVGRIRVEGDEVEVRRSIARQLAALRAFSTEFPTVTITISAMEGGELCLRAGSFGPDEEELVSLLSAATEDEAWRVLVSFRVEASEHQRIQELVGRAVPAGLVPVVDESPAALAMGFSILGDRHRVADLVGALRMSWCDEGSDLECLIEIEGPEPMVTVVRTSAEWAEIERTLRRSQARARDAAIAASAAERPTVLAELPEVESALRGELLSWIADDQILCVSRGTLLALPERVEAQTANRAVVRRRDGSMHLVRGDQRLEIPPAPADVERRLHGITSRGALFTDTRGTGEGSRTQLLLVDDKVEAGLELARVRALDATEGEAFALVTGPDGIRLLAIEIGPGWGHTATRPWDPDDNATDLAVVSASRVAVTVERGSRSVLYLVERANLVHARVVALPCVAPQIMGLGAQTIWITGMSPGPGRSRCDVFRVELFTGKVVIESAELDSPAFDVAVDEIGSEAVLAAQHAVYTTGDGAPRELVDLAGRTVTGIAYRRVPAVFVQEDRGARLVLGPDRVTVALPSPGHAPRFLNGTL